jgi:hypothetical protein
MAFAVVDDRVEPLEELTAKGLEVAEFAAIEERAVLFPE